MERPRPLLLGEEEASGESRTPKGKALAKNVKAMPQRSKGEDGKAAVTEASVPLTQRVAIGSDALD